MKIKKCYIYILLIIVLTFIDQVSKQLMFKISNGVQGFSISLFKSDFLLFTYVENHGGIFGIFQGHIRIFTLLSVILIFYVIKTEYNNLKKYEMPIHIALCFISAGAIGNMLDRFFRGYVIDMINFQYIWKFVFNVADMYIHIGVYIIIIYYIYTSIKKEKK